MEREEFLKEREQAELERISSIFSSLDENLYGVTKALIKQAARIKALQDWLWLDIKENGTTELFSQSTSVEPYERERVSAKHYATYSKLYSSIVKQLTDLLPKEEKEVARQQMDINKVLE